ncbi:MAG TPA: phosphoribosylglycinamide formyltransferase [Solirubrobacteraceae bacterium]
MNRSNSPFPIAVLVSGAGTNLQALLDNLHGRQVEVGAVVSNVPDAPALERARAAGVPTKVFRRHDYDSREKRDEAMAVWLRRRGIRLIVLAGFMEILSERFLNRFPDSIVNVHPSLLPKYPGMHAIDQAIEDKAKRFGVTVHLVDAGVDTGPIVLQKYIVLANARDSAEVLEALRPLEHRLLCEAVVTMVDGRREADMEAGNLEPKRAAAKQRAAKRQLVVAPA